MKIYFNPILFLTLLIQNEHNAADNRYSRLNFSILNNRTSNQSTCYPLKHYHIYRINGHVMSI